MNQLSDLKLLLEYRSGRSNLVEDFLKPCLQRCIAYNRSVGYFSSNLFKLITEDLINIAENKGYIKIICSPTLSEEDINAIANGYKAKEDIISEAINKEIDLAFKNEHTNLSILSTLISINVIDIKLALLKNSNGIYHEKLGLFEDNNNNFVSFKGSVNETYMAWDSKGNYESIDVYCSWKKNDEERALEHKNNFNLLWNGNMEEVESIDFPKVCINKLLKYSKGNLDELKIYLHKDNTNSRKKLKKELRDYQSKAIENWNFNNCKGIIKHATGSGKTFTAIKIIEQHLLECGTALIIVPSKLLLEQWETELKTEIHDSIILKAGDNNNRWKEKSRLFRHTLKNSIPLFHIVLVTLQTASSKDFMTKVSVGSHLLIVIDEVHQSGSQQYSQVFNLNAGKRLGLSATPERYGDVEGTKRIIDYFGGLIEPIFTLADAINAGSLVEYEYYPEQVSLDEDETQQWNEYTKKISFEAARSSNSKENNINEKLKLLLIQRLRIAKKANSKIALALRIIQKKYSTGQKWLIYCEDSNQLTIIYNEMKKNKLPVLEYHASMMGDRHASLDWFEKQGGILISIKCLDEGVDIPSISHAIILASSQNPRQFIQRRGRVLRKAPNKNLAVIYDAIVVPYSLEDSKHFVSLLTAEFCRAVEFAKNAINQHSLIELNRIAIDNDYDIDELIKVGEEEN